MDDLSVCCVGKRVRIVRFGVCFEGIIKCLDLTNRTVILDDVKVINGDEVTTLSGLSMLGGYGITSITFQETPLEANKRRADKKPDGAGPGLNDVKLYNCYKGIPGMPGKCVKYIVIDTFQSKFQSAIQHLYESSVISLAASGNKICRFGKICWLQVSTKEEVVYLFDILALGDNAFRMGLKSILQDEKILKVMHDCRLLSACLYHQYRISLCNVFDTQAADVLVEKQEAGGKWPVRMRLLPECLYRHLGFPPAALQSFNVDSNLAVWAKRPSPPGLLHLAARHMPSLLTLRTVLLDKLMTPFTKQVDYSLNVYRAQPDSVLLKVEHGCLELPQFMLPHLLDENSARGGK